MEEETEDWREEKQRGEERRRWRKRKTERMGGRGGQNK